MKTHLLASVLLVSGLGLVTPSFAADLGDPAYDWSGGYVGLHAGYGEAKTDGIFDSDELPGSPAEATYGDDLDVKGFLGGIQAGYNWQIDGFFWGLEADASLTGWDDDVGDFIGSGRIEFEFDALASLRLRAGVTADRALFYVTGGLAYANGEFTVINNAGPGQDTGSVDINAFGGVVGGGAAYAITENASLRLEGLYYIFDETKDTSELTLDSDDGDSLSLNDVIVVRAGLDWHF